MTREYAAVQLLRFGALTTTAFVQITGWPAAECRVVLAGLVAAKRVQYTGVYHDLYCLS